MGESNYGLVSTPGLISVLNDPDLDYGSPTLLGKRLQRFFFPDCCENQFIASPQILPILILGPPLQTIYPSLREPEALKIKYLGPRQCPKNHAHNSTTSATGTMIVTDCQYFQFGLKGRNRTPKPFR